MGRRLAKVDSTNSLKRLGPSHRNRSFLRVARKPPTASRNRRKPVEAALQEVHRCNQGRSVELPHAAQAVIGIRLSETTTGIESMTRMLTKDNTALPSVQL
jgi:hypothetical protein